MSLGSQHAHDSGPWLESVAADLHHAIRVLAGARSFTLAVLAALTIGIGANTAVFTVINTVLLHPLPYPDSDRIVALGRHGGGDVPEPVFAYWERHNPGFEDLAACRASALMNMSGGDRPELVATLAASHEYFRLLGATPIIGRTFSAAEDSPGGPRVALISYGLWQRSFGADSGVLRKTIRLGGATYSIAGVLSPSFKPYPAAEAWIPLQADANSPNQASVLKVFGRLPRGMTTAQAAAGLRAIAERYAESHTRLFSDTNVEVAYMRERVTGEVRPALLILLGAVGLVLLIACANVANLLMARATARQKEIAIRAALGAGRARIARQLLAESLLLSLAGGALGLAFGSWGVRALLAFQSGDLPRIQEMARFPVLDPWVAGFTAFLAIGTGVFFGLVPALQLSRSDLTSSLQATGRSSAGRKIGRTRSSLVAAEVALSVVLLCGAVLLIRSFAAMHSVSLGFDPHNLLTMETSLAGPAYSKSSATDALARRFVDRAQRIPGVESAAIASSLPLSGRIDMIFNIPGRTPPEGRHFNGDVPWRIVSPHYFAVLRIPLMAGRLFGEREPTKTVVISQAAARKFWPNSNPVGQTILIGPELGADYQVGMTEIIGVVGDVRERLNLEPQPVLYQMASQIPDGDTALINSYERSAILIRTRPGVDAMSLGPAVQQALLADRLPTTNVRTMEQVSLESTAQQNFNLLLLGSFAAIALLLASVGIYGVMSYSVEQRTHEIGIRAALGANRRDTRRLILKQALRLTLVGLAAGIAASFALTRLLNAQLFGVNAADPLTFVSVPLILLVVSIAAAWIPAIRATRVDAIVALRHE